MAHSEHMYYANLMVVSGANQPEGHVWVRGQWVDVRPSSINTLVIIPDIQQDDFSRLRGKMWTKTRYSTL